jgi:hypothetical protein
MTAFPLGSWRAPAEETSSGNIEAATKAFYETLLLGGSIADCRDAARLREPTFRIYSAEEAFLAGWRQAIGQLPTSNREIQEKAEEIVTLIKAPDPDRPDSGLHRRAKPPCSICASPISPAARVTSCSPRPGASPPNSRWSGPGRSNPRPRPSAQPCAT